MASGRLSQWSGRQLRVARAAACVVASVPQTSLRAHVGGAGRGGAKGLPIPAFRGLLPAELTSRGRDRRHSAVAAGACRPALWSWRNSRVAPLILTVPLFKTWLEFVCDAFPDRPANSRPATSLLLGPDKVLSRLTPLDPLHRVFLTLLHHCAIGKSASTNGSLTGSLSASVFASILATEQSLCVLLPSADTAQGKTTSSD